MGSRPIALGIPPQSDERGCEFRRRIVRLERLTKIVKGKCWMLRDVMAGCQQRFLVSIHNALALNNRSGQSFTMEPLSNYRGGKNGKSNQCASAASR